jgi:hypothetical protein
MALGRVRGSMAKERLFMVRFLRMGWLAVMAWAVLLTAVSAAWAMQPTVVQIEKNADGTYTYHFKITIDNAVTVESGKEEPNPDFGTFQNRAKVVDSIPG